MSLWHKLTLISIVSFVLLSANIGGYSIYILDESKNSQCAREMAARGDWIVPTFNGELRTDKPPLHYFFMGASYAIFGNGAFGARFFSAVFGVFTVLLTFLFTRQFVNERAAYFSVFTLLCSLGFVTQFHLAVPDPYLIFFIGAAIVAYFFYEQGFTRKYLYMAYAAVGLGVLTKGPIAIVLPGMAVFFYMVYKKKMNWRQLLLLNPPLGIFIILLIAGPWYYLVHIKTGGAWTEGFFLDHNVHRFNAPKEGHSGSFILPTLYAIIMTLPFSIFFPQSLVQAFREKSDVKIFSLITLACMVFFFSIASTKLPGYTSPIFPFAALLIGSYLSTLDLKTKGAVFSFLFYLILGFGMFAGSKIAIQEAKEIRHLTHLQWYFLPLPVLALISILLVFKKRFTYAAVCVGCSFLILHQLFFYFIYPEINHQNTVIKTYELVKNEKNLVAFHRLNPGYVHALNRKIPLLYEPDDLYKFVDAHGETVIFTRPEYIELIEGINYSVIAKEPDLFDGTTTVLLKASTE